MLLIENVSNNSYSLVRGCLNPSIRISPLILRPVFTYALSNNASPPTLKFPLNDKSASVSVPITPPTIAELGIELFGYCA